MKKGTRNHQRKKEFSQQQFEDDLLHDDFEVCSTKAKQTHIRKRFRSSVSSLDSSSTCNSSRDVMIGGPLAGRTFSREVCHEKSPHGPIKSIDTFCFHSNGHFSFSHRFWRDNLLSRKLEFTGTFALLPLQQHKKSHNDHSTIHIPVVEKPTELLAADGLANNSTNNDNTTRDSFSTGNHSNDADTKSGETPSERKEQNWDNRVTETHPHTTAETPSQLTAAVRLKVVLHWPPSMKYSELKDWHFDKTYSYLLLICDHPLVRPTANTATEHDLSRQSNATSGAETKEKEEGRERTEGVWGQRALLFSKACGVFVEQDS